jgi:hypothetical protein
MVQKSISAYRRAVTKRNVKDSKLPDGIVNPIEINEKDLSSIQEIIDNVSDMLNRSVAILLSLLMFIFGVIGARFALGKLFWTEQAAGLNFYYSQAAISSSRIFGLKIIAEKFYNKSNSFLQIDMAEYVDKNSISKLIGATAGYVGYEEGGLLSEFVRNNPNSLILFDEVDKAHPDIVNILLKIMDEGVIIDSFNRKIDFTNTIIVLTGNIGAEIETAKTMGFSNSTDKNSKFFSYQKAIKNYFKPELLARLDEVLVFNNKFSKEGLCKMIDFSILEIKNSLMEKSIKLNFNNEIKEFLYELVTKEDNNARAVQKILKNTLK